MATANSNPLNIENLIKDLCRLCYGKKYSEDQLEYVIHNLSINFECSSQINEPGIALEKIKNDLLSHHEIRKSRQVGELYAKLISRNSLKNFHSILHLLRKLSKYKSTNSEFSAALSNPCRAPFVSTPHNNSLTSYIPQSSSVGRSLNSSSLPSTIRASSASSGDKFGSSLAWGLSDARMNKTKDSQRNSTQYTTLNAAESVTLSDSNAETIAFRELLFVFQGINTEHITINSSSKHSKISVRESLSDSPYIISSVKKLAELGWLHNRIQKYISKHAKNQTFGLVGQAFCAALKHELSCFYSLLSVFQSELNMADHNITEQGASKFTLARLSVMVSKPLNQLKWLAMIIDNCKDNKGGALTTIIHSFMQTGDAEMRAVTKRILSVASQPIFYILNNWICNGELRDIFNEFFVAMDPNVSTERLWYHKYYLRQPENMIPSFITQQQAKKILLIGKSINFLKMVCHDTAPKSMNDTDIRLMNSGKFVHDALDFEKKLEDCVNEAYNSVCQHLLKVLHEKFKLLTHLHALRKFLLLGQGDFIRHLLDLLQDDLALPAAQVYRHNLTGLVEEAVRATNAQYEDQDVLARLSLRILEINPNETGWDVFTLVYFVDPPLSTIITPDIMRFYLRIFNFLWRAKRMEHNLAIMWTKTMEKSRLLYADVPEMRELLHSCNILASEMGHFVHQMQYYIAFEVLECSWADLIKKVGTSQDLDEIITAHQTFLETVMKRCLLDEPSKELFTKLRTIHDLIVKYEGLQESIFETGTSELENRKHFDKYMLDQEAKGVWGMDDEKESDEKTRQRQFRKDQIPKMNAQLVVCRTSFQDKVKNFLSELTSNDDSNLRHLSWRLNFNNNYKF